MSITGKEASSSPSWEWSAILFLVCSTVLFTAKVAKEDKTKMIFSETLAQAASIFLECFSFFFFHRRRLPTNAAHKEKKQLKENDRIKAERKRNHRENK